MILKQISIDHERQRLIERGVPVDEREAYLLDLAERKRDYRLRTRDRRVICDQCEHYHPCRDACHQTGKRINIGKLESCPLNKWKET